MQNKKILFSDYFNVDPDELDDYGALNISLVGDLPLFVDPFLIFHSGKEDYQKLHKRIIQYIKFLYKKSNDNNIDRGDLENLYCFSEVRENWLGFSYGDNHGRGLWLDFAKKLNKNLQEIFDSVDSGIAQSAHLEKLCLIESGVGRDSVSDFTVNLIKEYLLEYTQKFASEFIDADLCKRVAVSRV